MSGNSQLFYWVLFAFMLPYNIPHVESISRFISFHLKCKVGNFIWKQQVLRFNNYKIINRWNVKFSEYTYYLKWSFIHSFLYLHDCTFDIIFLSQNISVVFAQRLHTHLCRSRMRVPLGCRFIANQKREEHRISKPFEI